MSLSASLCILSSAECIMMMLLDVFYDVTEDERALRSFSERGHCL